VIEAAFAIWATVNVNMIAAIKDITIWQGIDPRSYTMVAGGGACGLHAIPLAEGLEMSRLLIPRTAGGLSAVGGIFTDTISEYNSSCLANTRAFDHETVNKVLKSLVDKATDFFRRGNIAEADRRIELYMEGHYPFQVWDLSVEITPFVDKNFRLDQNSVQWMETAFHEEHERTFTIKEDANVECVYWRVKAIGANHTAGLIPEQEYHSDNVIVSPAKRTGSRKIYFKKYNEAIVTPVFSGDNLVYGDVIQGPAIIEEPTTTIVVLPDYKIKVTRYNNYLIEGLRAQSGAGHGE
jgi:N-methylhydantoinase A